MAKCDNAWFGLLRVTPGLCGAWSKCFHSVCVVEIVDDLSVDDLSTVARPLKIFLNQNTNVSYIVH